MYKNNSQFVLFLHLLYYIFRCVSLISHKCYVTQEKNVCAKQMPSPILLWRSVIFTFKRPKTPIRRFWFDIHFSLISISFFFSIFGSFFYLVIRSCFSFAPSFFFQAYFFFCIRHEINCRHTFFFFLFECRRCTRCVSFGFLYTFTRAYCLHMAHFLSVAFE